jgi:RimJ/RimL family protein N-acetyltransferase
VINPAYRGNGYACEALERVLKFGFEVLELNRIEAKYIVGNDASRRVMEKCGMKFEGVARQSMLIKGKYRDIGKYAILKSEFADSGNAD